MPPSLGFKSSSSSLSAQSSSPVPLEIEDADKDVWALEQEDSDKKLTEVGIFKVDEEEEEEEAEEASVDTPLNKPEGLDGDGSFEALAFFEAEIEAKKDYDEVTPASFFSCFSSPPPPPPPPLTTRQVLGSAAAAAAAAQTAPMRLSSNLSYAERVQRRREQDRQRKLQRHPQKEEQNEKLLLLEQQQTVPPRRFLKRSLSNSWPNLLGEEGPPPCGPDIGMDTLFSDMAPAPLVSDVINVPCSIETPFERATTTPMSPPSPSLSGPDASSVEKKASVLLPELKSSSSSPSSQLPMTGIEKPLDTDVVCGRGVTTNRHPGNKSFREIVNAHKEVYVTSTKKQKMFISRRIVDHVRSRGECGGRFLERDLKTGRWYDIGDKRALEKTSQALRDHAAPLRKHMSEDLSSADPRVLQAILEKSASAGAKQPQSPSCSSQLFPGQALQHHRRANSTSPEIIRKTTSCSPPEGRAKRSKNGERSHHRRPMTFDPAAFSNLLSPSSVSGSPASASSAHVVNPPLSSAVALPSLDVSTTASTADAMGESSPSSVITTFPSTTKQNYPSSQSHYRSQSVPAASLTSWSHLCLSGEEDDGNEETASLGCFDREDFEWDVSI